MVKRDIALEWVERQIKKTRQALGNAERKAGVTSEELENLQRTIDVLEYISGEVLRTEMSHPIWTCVKDRLPEEGQLVAYIPTCNQGSVYIGNFYCVGKNGGVMFSHNEGRHRTNYYAKYWMPLPEPPKEEEK